MCDLPQVIHDSKGMLEQINVGAQITWQLDIDVVNDSLAQVWFIRMPPWVAVLCPLISPMFLTRAWGRCRLFRYPGLPSLVP